MNTEPPFLPKVFVSTGIFSMLFMLFNAFTCNSDTLVDPPDQEVASFWSDTPYEYPGLGIVDSLGLDELDTLKLVLDTNAAVAEKLIDSLIREWRSTNSVSNFVRAHAWYQKGRACYFTDREQEAITAYHKAVDLLERSPVLDRYTLVTLYSNLCYNFNYLGIHADSALYYGERAIQHLPKNPVQHYPNLVLGVYNYTATSAERLGDYTLSEQCFAQSITITRDTSAEAYRVGQTFYNYADVFYRTNRLDSAYHYNLRSLQTFENASSLDHFDSLDVAKVHQRIALIYHKWDRDPAEGLQSIQRSIQLFQQLNAGPEPLAASYNIAGLLYAKAGQRGAASDYFHRAASLNEQHEHTYQLGENHDNLGDWWRHDRQLDRALEHYDQAIVCFYGPEKIGSVVDAQHRLSLFTPLVSRASVLNEQYRQGRATLSELFTAYARIDTLLQSIRRDYTDEQSQIFTLAKLKPVYEEALEMCYAGWQTDGERHWLDRAVTYFERGKGLVLQESLQREKAVKGILSEAEYLRERSLQRKRFAYFQKSQNGQLPAVERQKYEELRLACEFDLRGFRDSLAQHHAAYRSLRPSAGNLQSAALQEQLTDEEQLIDFFVGETATYALVLTSDEADLVRLPISKEELAATIEMFRAGLESPGFNIGNPGERDRQLRTTGYALYHTLFSTVLADRQKNRLILLPDDVLAYLPFEALLRDTVADDRAEYYHEYPFLIREYTIGYQFSPALWYDQRSNARQPSTGSGILAVVPIQEKSMEVALTGARAIGLSALTYNTAEIDPLEVLGNVSVMSNAGATKSAFLAKAPTFSMLHFAGHGYADPRNAYRSFLAFDLENAAVPNDELLLLPELYALNLSADLVVLSACQTADGRLRVGEGVISLSRAMTLAGAASVVSSLWLVNQQSKVGIFETFYAELADGKAKDDALRQAKLRYLEDSESAWSHPYHWAGMTLVGEVQSLEEVL